MNLHLTGRHVPLTQALRDYVQKRFTHVTKYRAKLEDAHVILGLDGQRQFCEIVLTGKHLRLAARESSPDLYASVDRAVDRLVRQLRRVKEKTRENRHKHLSAMGKGAAPSDERDLEIARAAHERDGPRIVPSDRYAAKPMTPEDAAWHLADEGLEFLVFQNAATGGTNVIYRRGEGVFGWIAPDFGRVRAAPGGRSAR